MWLLPFPLLLSSLLITPQHKYTHFQLLTPSLLDPGLSIPFVSSGHQNIFYNCVHCLKLPETQSIHLDFSWDFNMGIISLWKCRMGYDMWHSGLRFQIINLTHKKENKSIFNYIYSYNEILWVWFCSGKSKNECKRQGRASVCPTVVVFSVGGTWRHQTQSLAKLTVITSLPSELLSSSSIERV